MAKSESSITKHDPPKDHNAEKLAIAIGDLRRIAHLSTKRLATKEQLGRMAKDAADALEG